MVNTMPANHPAARNFRDHSKFKGETADDRAPPSQEATTLLIFRGGGFSWVDMASPGNPDLDDFLNQKFSEAFD